MRHLGLAASLLLACALMAVPACGPIRVCSPGHKWCLEQGGGCIPEDQKCGPYVPPACPATCPEASACTDPAKGCEPIPAPGPVCKCDAGGPCCGCYHWPPGSSSWQLAPCAPGSTCSAAGQCEAVPPPECPATCPAGQVCLDPIVGCEPTHPPPTCEIPADEGWTPVMPDPGPAPGLLAKILRAQDQIGDRCGKNAHASGLLLVGKLNGWGECSALFGEDMLMVRTSAPQHQEWDVVRGDGCWIQLFSGTWTPPGSVPPPTDCPAPMPLRYWPDGSPHWDLDSHPHGAVIDHTPRYRDEYDSESATCPRCTAWGFGQIDGQARCGCPMGGDQTPARLCREQWIGGGWHTESRNGAMCEQHADNPLWLLPNGGNCRLCSIADPRVCGGWY